MYHIEIVVGIDTEITEMDIKLAYFTTIIRKLWNKNRITEIRTGYVIKTSLVTILSLLIIPIIYS